MEKSFKNIWISVPALVVATALTTGCGGGGGGSGGSGDISPAPDTPDRIVEQVPVSKSLTTIETFPAEGLRQFSGVADAENGALSEQQKALLFEYYAAAVEEENQVFSSLDRQLLFSSVALGAHGESRKVVEAASGFDTRSDDFLARLSDWDFHINNTDGVASLRYLWGQTGYQFSVDYLEQQARWFGPRMAALDFLNFPYESRSGLRTELGDDHVLGGVNDRSRLATAQMITAKQDWPVAVSRSEVRGRMEIGTSIGMWASTPVQRMVDMVRFEGVLNSTRGDGYKAVELPLAGGELAMMVVTPDSRDTFHSVHNAMSAEFFETLRSELAPNNEAVMLPKFSLSKLNSDLFLGAAGREPDVANPDATADFSAINGEGYLFLQNASQNVSMTVSGDGIESKAVSGVVHQASADEPESLFGGSSASGGFAYTSIAVQSDASGNCYYEADARPFIFFTYMRNTGVLLNIGHVVDLPGEYVIPEWQTNYSFECGDSPTVEIYKSAGEVQCESSGVPLSDMRQTLESAGVEVLYSESKYNDLAYITVCGGASGLENVFYIRESGLTAAQNLGFLLRK